MLSEIHFLCSQLAPAVCPGFCGIDNDTWKEAIACQSLVKEAATFSPDLGVCLLPSTHFYEEACKAAKQPGGLPVVATLAQAQRLYLEGNSPLDGETWSKYMQRINSFRILRLHSGGVPGSDPAVLWACNKCSKFRAKGVCPESLALGLVRNPNQVE